MDDIVKQALAKWPNVPDCYGWLALDQRGHWYMRDDRIQEQGLFPHPKGSLLLHDKLLAFIGRNYGSDSSGQWYFQNGPQRVYIELEICPWVWRLTHDNLQTTVISHTNLLAHVQASYEDEFGHLLLLTNLGLGLVHTQDMLIAAEVVEAGHWNPIPIANTDIESLFGFVKSPQINYAAAVRTSPTI